MKERFTHDERLKINQPFNPFTPKELSVLGNNGIWAIQKWFEIEGVKGNLHIDITYQYPHDEGITFKDSVTPWESEPLQENHRAEKYSYGICMCFNNNDRLTPAFKLFFPNTVRTTFYGLVCDWDVVGDTYDATQYFFQEGDLDHPVLIFLPKDILLVSPLEVTATDVMIRYPRTFLKQLI